MLWVFNGRMETLRNPAVDLQHFHRGFLWGRIKQQGSFSHSLPIPALKPCLQVRILGLPSGGQPTLVPWDLSFLLLQRMTRRLYLHTLRLSPTTTRGNNEQPRKMAGEKGFHPLLCGAESSRSGLQTLKGIHRDKGQFGLNLGVIHSPDPSPCHLPWVWHSPLPLWELLSLDLYLKEPLLLSQNKGFRQDRKPEFHDNEGQQ